MYFLAPDSAFSQCDKEWNIRRLSVLALLLAALVVSALPAAAEGDGRWKAHLTGAGVAAPVDTQAQGQANFKLGKDGESLECKLTVAGIVNASSAELHLATPGSMGTVVMYLFQADKDDYIPGRFSGLAIKGAANAVGYYTESDLEKDTEITSMDALRKAMDEGKIYVSVHTGNGYEALIRGQVR